MDNTVLIVLDTLRKDYGDKYIWPVLRKYGFKKYDRAIAPAPWTLPSHASMLTGLYPLYHGARFSKNNIKEHQVRLPRRIREMLVENILKEREYSTPLITANVFLTDIFGITGWTQEFDTLIDAVIMNIPEKMRKKYNAARRLSEEQGINLLNALVKTGGLPLLATVVYARGLVPLKRAFVNKWPKNKGIRETYKILRDLADRSELDSSKKYFLTINTMEVHEPYSIYAFFDSPEKYRKKYPKFAEYQAKELKKIMDLLKKEGILETAKVIVVSDHGQLLGEHGKYGHNNYLYDELIRVPLYTNKEIFTHEMQESGSWIPLTLIKKAIMGNREKIEPQRFALSESFRCCEKYSYRIAVYYKDYKGIFNVDDWKWESWKTYNEEEEVPEEAKKEMMKIVLRHLKGALAAKEAKKLVPKR